MHRAILQGSQQYKYLFTTNFQRKQRKENKYYNFNQVTKVIVLRLHMELNC